MRKIALAVAALALTSSASAADDPAKAPASITPAPASAPDWTGFYIGGHVGATWLSNSDMSISDPNLPVPAALKTVRLSGSSAAHVLGGIQGGYNWQFSPRWVAGIEADFSGSSLNNSDSAGDLVSNGGLLFVDSSLRMSEEVKWLATLRPKVGFLVLPDTLLYATGGVALENVDYDASVKFVLARDNSSFNKTNVGYAVGGGAEWQVISNVLLRAEYLFYGFGKDRTGEAEVGAPEPLKFKWSGGNVQVFRVGVSYKF